jgi:hypothetical protein
MFPRDAAGTGAAVGTAFALVTPDLGFALAALAACGCFGAEAGFPGFVFFADVLTDFLEAFFATDFLEDFLANVFADLFVLLAVAFFARFFDAAALATRGDTFLVFFLFEGFFLAATTNSLRLKRDCQD